MPQNILEPAMKKIIKQKKNVRKAPLSYFIQDMADLLMGKPSVLIKMVKTSQLKNSSTKLAAEQTKLWSLISTVAELKSKVKVSLKNKKPRALVEDKLSYLELKKERNLMHKMMKGSLMALKN